MPLNAVRETAAFTDPGTLAIVFQMRNFEIDQPVRVTVQHDALLKLGGGANPLSVFELHRAEIETLASEKFDRQGGASEITILEQDLLV